MTNVSQVLADSAGRQPTARALVCDHTTTSYLELYKEVARFAEYLTDRGLKPGDRVGVMLPNGLEFAVVFYGVLHAGGVVLPLSPALHACRVWHNLELTGANILFVTPRHSIMGAVAAVTADVHPVEVGSHGIADLTAGFPGNAEPVGGAAGDPAISLPVGETIHPHPIQLSHGELVSSQAVSAGLLPLE